MRWVYVLSAWVHILSVITWLGGMFFLALVIVPTLRQEGFRASAAQLVRVTGHRFRWIGWLCLLLILTSGTLLMWSRGFLTGGETSRLLWHSQTGQVLAAKLLIFCLIILLSLVHDFWVGPRAVKSWTSDPEAEATRRLRRATTRIGRATFYLALVMTLLGVLLVRGTPW